MSERREGWYWCRWLNGSQWECDYWDGERWDDNGVDAYPEIIGPRIPTPDEPWQCVPAEPTDEMEQAALDAHMPFGDMRAAIQAAVVHAPELGED